MSTGNYNLKSARNTLGISDIDIKPKNPYKNVLTYIIVTVLVLLFLGTVAGIIAWAVTKENGKDADPTTTLPAIPLPEQINRRIDCYPESEGGVDLATQEKCENRNCIWSPIDDATDDVPDCYVPQPENSVDGTGFGYRVLSGSDLNVNTGGMVQRWYLQRINKFAIYGDNIENVTFEVEYVGESVLRFKFDDTDNDARYKVPVPLNLERNYSGNPLYRVDVSTDGVFSFKIIRVATGTELWNTGVVGGFSFSDQFLQISTKLPSSNIYGFGENVHWKLKHDMNYNTWPMFARDEASASGNSDERKNLYSVHPYYECLEEDGNAHGVLLLNSNAMDYTMTPLPMLTYKTIGGILDFYMFLGPTPENVVQQYTGVIGRPYMPPYWMLGFQLCRYGYANTSDLKAAVDRTLYYDIPYDVQYADIDHMYKQRDFTIDEAFDNLTKYFQELRSIGLKTIIILDPALEINDTYPPYTEGLEKDIFIKWPDKEVMPQGDYEEYNNTNMMGYVWPEWKVVFPDFFLDKTADLWTKWIVEFRNKIAFDALWVDMNEPANFGTNENRPWNWPEDDPRNWSLKCPSSMWDDPPYRTKAAYMYDNAHDNKTERLSSKTLCMVGVQGNSGEYRHYDVHSLYGWKQSQVSLDSVRAAVKNASDGQDLRSMVLTRSSYPGTAKHAGRWLGDNRSAWPDVALSVIGMLEFNIMGFPYIGADICGFFGEATPELCMRWQELGAFYPFARNHNTKGATHQDPGYFGPVVANRTRETMLIRYKLLPYLYTLFHKAHTIGSTVIRPLFHEFASDVTTWDIDKQFLWGPALLISPIMEQEAMEHSYYLPAGKWFDWYTYDSLVTDGDWISMKVTIDTFIQLHVRGGYILPWQNPANNTHFSRKNNFGILVALDATNGRADGEIFWDDGDSIETYANGNYYMATFQAESNMVNMSVIHNGISVEMDNLYLDTVQIMGVQNVSVVNVEGENHADFTFSLDKQLIIHKNKMRHMVLLEELEIMSDRLF